MTWQHSFANYAENPRWAGTELAPPSGGLDVALTWKAPCGKLSRVMGLAPIGTMPVTRRAPYVALAAWTGDHANPWNRPQTPRNVVMFSDMPHGLTEEVHRHWKEESTSLTEQLVTQTGDGLPGYKLTFRLDSAVRGVAFNP